MFILDNIFTKEFRVLDIFVEISFLFSREKNSASNGP